MPQRIKDHAYIAIVPGNGKSKSTKTKQPGRKRQVIEKAQAVIEKVGCLSPEYSLYARIIKGAEQTIAWRQEMLDGDFEWSPSGRTCASHGDQPVQGGVSGLLRSSDGVVFKYETSTNAK